MRTPSNKGRKLGGRAAVIALAPAIREALTAGVHLTAIYEQHERTLGISYAQFCKHVRNYIRKKEIGSKEETHALMARGLAGAVPPVASPPRGATVAAERGAPISTPPRQARRFNFDPTAAHRRKDELF